MTSLNLILVATELELHVSDDVIDLVPVNNDAAAVDALQVRRLNEVGVGCFGGHHQRRCVIQADVSVAAHARLKIRIKYFALRYWQFILIFILSITVLRYNQL